MMKVIHVCIYHHKQKYIKNNLTNITELKLKNQNVEIWKEYFLTYNSTAYLNNEHILVFLSRAHRYLYLVSSVIKILAHHLHGYYFLLWCYFLCEILICSKQQRKLCSKIQNNTSLKPESGCFSQSLSDNCQLAFSLPARHVRVPPYFAPHVM